MKYLSEFRNVKAIKSLSRKIETLVEGNSYTFMEVCGTHTMAIARFGIRELLPSGIRLISGPGCPVCVTTNDYIDHAIALSRHPDTTITTFGDMMRVPGSTSTLEKEKASGRDIRVVYSPLDALKLAKKNSKKETIFLSVGFETTTPTIASTILMSKEENITNFSMLCANKLVPPALEILLNTKNSIDGFLLPGHVSTIIGSDGYQEILADSSISASIAGFEPTDILESILDLVEQTTSNRPKVSIKYSRAVKSAGNSRAKEIVEKVFNLTDAGWRGVGTIPKSGLKIGESLSDFDAAKKFDVDVEPTREVDNCHCGEILQGLSKPTQCPLFGTICTPSHPVGACMVSSEGTCAAWHKYRIQ